MGNQQVEFTGWAKYFTRWANAYSINPAITSLQLNGDNIFTIFQFVDFVNFDMFTIHILRNFLWKKKKTKGLNKYFKKSDHDNHCGSQQIYLFVLLVFHLSIFQTSTKVQSINNHFMMYQNTNFYLFLVLFDFS